MPLLVVRSNKNHKALTSYCNFCFCLGFISQLLHGRPIDVCVRCGVWAATQIIQQDGCTFPTDLQIPKEFRAV